MSEAKTKARNVRPAGQVEAAVGINPKRPHIVFLARLRGLDKSQGIAELSEWEEERTYYPSSPLDMDRVRQLMVKGWTPIKLVNFDSWECSSEEKEAWKTCKMELSAHVRLYEIEGRAKEVGEGQPSEAPKRAPSKVRPAPDAKGN